MKIGYLGTGVWGFALSNLLASNQHQIIAWTQDQKEAKLLQTTRKHPKIKDISAHRNITYTTDLNQLLQEVDVLVESVTSSGVRDVFTLLKNKDFYKPIIITSKGIEQKTGLILPEVVLEVLGESYKDLIGCLSGPGYAQEVILGLPTSVVASGYSKESMALVQKIFSNESFRVYPNLDIQGVCFGGALKNVVAIACGLSDGMELGSSSKASLITRGLHEITKLAISFGCKKETLYGLSGMGDMCLTCSSSMSRNYRFGYLIAQKLSPQAALEKIGMVVEGAYTAVSALELSKKQNIPMPISEAVYLIIQEKLSPKQALHSLMQRAVKQEHL